MKNKSEVKIFLAHANEDKVRVIELYRKLKEAGYQPWLDKMELMPGQQWKTEIPKALKKSDIFIACLSETSIKKQGYIQSEFRLALRQAAEMPADAIYLIPLKFDECRIPDLEQAEYGTKLKDYQWLNYWEEGAFERLVAAIEYRREEIEVIEKEVENEKKKEVAEQYREAGNEEKGKKFQEGSALEIWQKKLTYFQEEEAITSNPEQKFELKKRIEECRLKIEEIETENLTEKRQETGGSEESRLKQYREKVREYLKDHRLSNVGKVLLEQKRKSLSLTEQEAEKILAEEQAPICQAREEYEELLEELIKADCYPFDEETEKELEKLKEEKKLCAWEVMEIEQSILRKAEVEYQRKKLQKKLKPLSFEIVKVDEKGGSLKRENGTAQYFSEDLGNSFSLDMMFIPSGKFMMGTSDQEIERLCQEYHTDYFKTEGPQHEVNISQFYMGRYPITQAQWRALAALPQEGKPLELDPSNFKGENRPVEQVSWQDAIEFCARLLRHTGKKYRLPSEAEWEYACRAGTETSFHFGETITSELANYDASYTYQKEAAGKYREKTTPVRSFPPNAFGLYDMHGNVWEWCLDDWHDTYKGAPKDGSTWIDNHSQYKYLRGGSWNYIPVNCRSAMRSRSNPGYGYYDYGFRVVWSA